MSGRQTVYEDSLESLTIDLETSASPTAVAPEFALSTNYRQPGTFVVGAWSGAWSSATKLTTAITPTLGGTDAGLTITSGSTYYLWAKVTVGSEISVWVVGTVAVP